MKPTPRCHDNVSFCCFSRPLPLAAAEQGPGALVPAASPAIQAQQRQHLPRPLRHPFCLLDLSSLIDPRARGIVCSQWANPTTIRLESEIRSPCPKDLSALVLQGMQPLANEDGPFSVRLALVIRGFTPLMETSMP
ncbi:uncharacterized protein TrAtP1_012418 [Trichoderma atroviride]|uniref:Uncharacterized protein n=1 Tax=Hypocrea atroviridis (strain ATCC 20476 / IMI 206040) TaxID=452589 RepID=G9NPJ7_HYPAI|nr:uncharacterized protein TRIATDRAFT_298600 [Trichoderma atroviride IMI 206040]EHK47464.1 hypothetical protein TRIATDRAFT_298600 [Trichoderma atroviride IMI 206040]UKZ71464.1 hypothetical protein TrAtP1_012418 [Trichoderma atroviride]